MDGFMNMKKVVSLILCAVMSAALAVAAFAAADINGDGNVNNKDVIALFGYVSGGDRQGDESAYDFNGDGKVNNRDVLSLFRYVSGTKNNLELFVKQLDLSSYTLEETYYENGAFINRQFYEYEAGYEHLTMDYTYFDEYTGVSYNEKSEYYSILNENGGIIDLIYERTRQHKWYALESEQLAVNALNPYNIMKFDLQIDPSLFEAVSENVFTAKEEYVNEAGHAFFYDDMSGEEFVYLELTVINGDLGVYAKSVIANGDTTDEKSYEVLLCKTGATAFDIPEYGEDLSGESIYNCYLKDNGDEVFDVTGRVMSFISASEHDCKIYIDDGKRGILVLLKGTGRPDNLYIGKEIAVYGRIEIENRLVKIVVTDQNDVEFLGRASVYYPQKDDFDDFNYNMVNTTIDVTGVSVDSSVLDENGGEIRVTDSYGNTIPLIVTPYEAPLFNEIFKKVTPGTEIDIQRVAVSRIRYNRFLCITEQTKVDMEFGILLSYTSKKVTESGTVSEALFDLTVHYRAEDGAYRLLSPDEYTITCDDYKYERGVYTAVISYNGDEAEVEMTVMVPGLDKNASYATLEETGRSEANTTTSLPSTGDVHVLVIPIGFENTDYEKYGTPEEILDRIDKAFNGTKEDTGWYSLSEYYREASYGKLNITADILDIYQAGEQSDLYTKERVDIRYLIEALTYYDDEIDYSLYDQNEDTHIDCVYLIYLAPYYDQMSFYQSADWWAFYTILRTNNIYDGLYPYGYIWYSYEFFDKPLDNADINCEVLIHETGHALGLDDYYDYSVGGVTGGIGSFGLMDANQGDLDPYSKAILGWINPDVTYRVDYDTTLCSFEDTGDALIISKDYNGTYFEEYYIIGLYTPTGTNEYKKDKNCGLPSKTGIMLWHISASLCDKDALNKIYSIAEITLYNNGSTVIKLIDLVCADGSTEIDKNKDYLVSDKDLFSENSVISDLVWYDGTKLNATISIGEFTTVDGVEQTEISVRYN